jgi:protein SHQ1
MFDHGIDGRYLLSKLYLDDYCCWIQVASERALAQLSKDASEATVRLDLGQIGWSLPELVAEAAGGGECESSSSESSSGDSSGGESSSSEEDTSSDGEEGTSSGGEEEGGEEGARATALSAEQIAALDELGRTRAR